MSYENVRETLKGNIAFLSTQIKPWIDKYNCKNAFDLFTKSFEGNDKEKLIIHGYIHRRDAYIQILNVLESEQPNEVPDTSPCDV
jgi:hypothetical protein